MPNFVELTLNENITQFMSARILPQYRPSRNGCWTYQQENPNNRNMVCIAMHDGQTWTEIGYTIVNRDGTGNAHPWGTRASIQFQNFAMSEEHCKQAILNFLNANYPPSRIENITMQSEPQQSSPRKSAASARPAVKNEKKAEKQAKKKEDTPSLKECKTIIRENFEKFQKVYKERYGKEFRESDDVKWFFRKEDLEKIKEWNEKASNVDDLIDLCAFYELILGNPSKADVVILGNNPGAKGIFERISSFEEIFNEMKDRKDNNDKFYPMSSVIAMQNRPWFPNRLIYGVGGSTWQNRDTHDGILYPFMQNGKLDSLCHYADRIATVELVPYHTKTFAAGERFLDEFDLFDPTPVIQAMKNNAVIIALFRNAAERWCEKWREYRRIHPEVEDLEGYTHFYVNHKKKGKSQAGANASLSRQSLRRYPEFQASISPKDKRELYPSYDAYSEITDYLEMEKNWKRIKA